jgi:hypothetical protein
MIQYVKEVLTLVNQSRIFPDLADVGTLKRFILKYCSALVIRWLEEVLQRLSA